ncbi:MAG: hypothetical protein IH598_16570 [Bacteroidales bacterium]|nr:hypothetical protein [Bacteroidales bacterium]
MAIIYKAVPKKNPLNLAQPARTKAIVEVLALSEGFRRVYLKKDLDKAKNRYSPYNYY